jgi:L-fuculose-phosphate aldolase
MVASNDGNISARLGGGKFLITATGVCKGDLTDDQILTVDEDGNVLAGSLKPTSEMKMHLAVYKERANVMAIVHAHPPKATAFAVARVPLNQVTLPEVVIMLGTIPLCEYGTPSTEELPATVVKHIHEGDALLLSNHGALTVGGTVMEAYFNMETLEHFAGITLNARILGGEHILTLEETDKLKNVRSDVFGKSRI